MHNIIVVDVGNTRIKWGRSYSGLVREVASLPADSPDAWQAQWQQWNLQHEDTWVVCGVHPARRDALVAWLQQRSDDVYVLTSFRQLPLKVQVDAPDKVGIDRLLNAVAANQRRSADSSAIIVDAGSAVTVDYVDPDGVFRGGAIFPGFRLMAHALHEHTALLPLVSIDGPVEPPGTNTILAMQLGIFHTVLGGIERLIAQYHQRFPTPTEIFLTGGDAGLLLITTLHTVHLWPEMTLEGIVHSRAR